MVPRGRPHDPRRKRHLRAATQAGVGDRLSDRMVPVPSHSRSYGAERHRTRVHFWSRGLVRGRRRDFALILRTILALVVGGAAISFASTASNSLRSTARSFHFSLICDTRVISRPAPPDHADDFPAGNIHVDQSQSAHGSSQVRIFPPIL